MSPGSLRVVVTGASGLIGSALRPRLEARGDRLVRLVRHPAREVSEVAWDPEHGVLDPAALEGCDAVVHLAGERIAGGRWTAARKRRILESRAQGTRLIAESLARLVHRPRVLVSSSAIGAYGNRGDEELTEASALGTGFLAEVTNAWEAATEPAASAGIRVVCLRTGIVLAKHGGALAALLPLARMGLGGALGSGRQWWSWISLDDLIALILLALDRAEMSGPINAVSPHPVRQREFAEALGRVLGRPALLPAPVVALRLSLGEMADQMLLASQRVRPAAVEHLGFEFHDPELEPALHRLLGRAPLTG